MTISYSWTIDKVSVLPTFGGKSDVVNNVDYTITARDGDKIATLNSGAFFEEPDLTSFVEFKNLNDVVYVQWVKNSLGESSIAVFEKMLEDQINGVIVDAV
jgi:hypothetical protein